MLPARAPTSLARLALARQLRHTTSRARRRAARVVCPHRPGARRGRCLVRQRQLVRILLVNKFAYVTGGADRHCLALADALCDRSHEVRFLSVASKKNLTAKGEFIQSDVTRDTRYSSTEGPGSRRRSGGLERAGRQGDGPLACSVSARRRSCSQVVPSVIRRSGASGLAPRDTGDPDAP